MPYTIVFAIFVHGIGFFTEAIHTQARKCLQSLFATVPTMHYSATVQLFSVDKPHQRFLAVVDVVQITTSRNKFMVSGLRKSLRNTLSHTDMIVTDS